MERILGAGEMFAPNSFKGSQTPRSNCTLFVLIVTYEGQICTSPFSPSFPKQIGGWGQKIKKTKEWLHYFEH